jgi:hypothetical protein
VSVLGVPFLQLNSGHAPHCGAALRAGRSSLPQQRLYFLPLPQGQKELRPIRGGEITDRRGAAHAAPSPSSCSSSKLQARLGAMTIVITLELQKLQLQIGGRPEECPVQAFAPNRADQAFDEGMRTRRVRHHLLDQRDGGWGIVSGSD